MKKPHLDNHEPCICSGPGQCPRYGYLVGQRGWELCSGNCPAERPCTEEGRAMFLASIPLVIARFSPTTKQIILGGTQEELLRSIRQERAQRQQAASAPTLTATQRISRFAQALKDWKAAGQPIRSEEERRQIHLICTNSGTEGGPPCERYDAQRDRCGVCGCGLSPKARGTMPKMVRAFGIPDATAMATYHCPIEKW